MISSLRADTKVVEVTRTMCRSVIVLEALARLNLKSPIWKAGPRTVDRAQQVTQGEHGGAQ